MGFPAALLAAVAISLPVSRPGEAAFPGANGKIAFYSDRAFLGSDVYTMNADGGGATRLTFGGGQAPAWSADGTKIAFRDGSVTGDIWVMNADGSAQTN
ncbi:MAG: TolB family protein, partial [Sphingomicrobium sp.]